MPDVTSSGTPVWTPGQNRVNPTGPQRVPDTYPPGYFPRLEKPGQYGSGQGTAGTGTLSPWDPANGTLVPIGPNGQTGSSGFWGEVHDWYRIILALVVLYLLMRYYPKWAIPLGALILAGAVLSSPQAVSGFTRLVGIVQTGSVSGSGSGG